MAYTKPYSSFLNCQKRIFDGEGEFDFPVIAPTHIDLSGDFSMIDLGKTGTCRRTDNKVIHFYSDDYYFNRVWNTPDKYIALFQKFKAVLSPGFSMYTDFPMAVQIFNAYRRKWCAAYWQEHGVTVIPTILWSDARSYDWCFDGDPVGGVVSVSSLGTQKKKDSKRGFLNGYNEMLERLKPEAILFYGIVPKECKGNIIPVESSVSAFRRSLEENES